MTIRTISGYERWLDDRHRREDARDRAYYFYGVEDEDEDEDEDRYQVWCEIEAQTCSDAEPCTSEDIENKWDLHRWHVEEHCIQRTCSSCQVLDHGPLGGRYEN